MSDRIVVDRTNNEILIRVSTVDLSTMSKTDIFNWTHTFLNNLAAAELVRETAGDQISHK